MSDTEATAAGTDEYEELSDEEVQSAVDGDTEDDGWDPMEEEIDFDGVDNPDNPAPKGRYTLVLATVEAKRSKKGQKMVFLGWNITGDEDNSGKYVRDYCMMEGDQKPRGWWSLKRYAAAAGVDTWQELLPLAGGDNALEVEADLIVQKGSKGYGPSNSIDEVYPVGGPYTSK